MKERLNLRTVFMGTPDFAVPSLQALHEISKVQGVFTQPDRTSGRGLKIVEPPVKSEAKRLGLPVFQPDRLRTPEAMEQLKSLKPDLIVVAAYGQILKQEVLDLPRWGCLNVHASLLPRWRGAAPIQWAILSGDTETGVTLMQMELGLDSGPMLLKLHTPISEEDRAQDVHDRLAILGESLIRKGVPQWVSGELTPEKQNPEFVTLAPKIEKSMGVLDLRESATVLERKIRALNPWPGTWVHTQGGRLFIRKARLHADRVSDSFEIVEKMGQVWLPCAEGSLILEAVQWEGKRIQDVASFLNGLRGRGASLPLELEPIWIT